MAAENGSSLPENITTQTLTKLKSKFLLKWASLDMLNLLTIVEKTMINFVKEGIIFLHDGFKAFLRGFIYDKVPRVECHDGNKFMTEIIFKNINVAFQMYRKKKKHGENGEKKRCTHTQVKLSKPNVSSRSMIAIKCEKPPHFFIQSPVSGNETAIFISTSKRQRQLLSF
jgi:hypothetical protein